MQSKPWTQFYTMQRLKWLRSHLTQVRLPMPIHTGRNLSSLWVTCTQRHGLKLGHGLAFQQRQHGLGGSTPSKSFWELWKPSAQVVNRQSFFMQRKTGLNLKDSVRQHDEAVASKVVLVQGFSIESGHQFVPGKTRPEHLASRTGRAVVQAAGLRKH